MQSSLGSWSPMQRVRPTVTDNKKITVANNYQLTVKQEAYFSMRTSDWVRLRKRVETLKKQRRDFTSAAWAFVGIAVSDVLSGVAWAATYRTFSESQVLEFAWVWPTLIVAGIAAALLAVGAFAAAHVVSGAASATAADICDDMDEIHDPNAPEPQDDAETALAALYARNRAQARTRALIRRANGSEVFPSDDQPDQT